MQLAAVAAPKQIKSFVLSSMVMSSIYFLHIRRMRPSKGYISLQGVEKVTFLRLIKNAQMQVDLCEIPLAGAPEILRRERF